MKELTLKDLEKLDVIEVTDEQIKKIKQWCIDNKEFIKENSNNIKFMINEGLIKRPITTSSNIYMIIHYLIENEKLMVTDYGYHSTLKEYRGTVSMTKPIINLKNGIKLAYYEPVTIQEDLEDTEILSNGDFHRDMEELEIVITMFFQILIYSQLNQEFIIRQTRTHTHKSQSKKDKRKGKKPKVKLIKQNIIRLNTEHLPMPTEEEIKHYERHTFGWTVRGHWRTYQSGKKVWIKPQVRGDKDKVEGKIYEI